MVQFVFYHLIIIKMMQKPKLQVIMINQTKRIAINQLILFWIKFNMNKIKQIHK